jgi:hypothetical protein
MSIKINKSSEEKNRPPFQDLKPAVNQILGFAARTTFKMMKFLIKTAFQIPGFVKKMVSNNPPVKRPVSDQPKQGNI